MCVSKNIAMSSKWKCVNYHINFQTVSSIAFLNVLGRVWAQTAWYIYKKGVDKRESWFFRHRLLVVRLPNIYYWCQTLTTWYPFQVIQYMLPCWRSGRRLFRHRVYLWYSTQKSMVLTSQGRTQSVIPIRSGMVLKHPWQAFGLCLASQVLTR